MRAPKPVSTPYVVGYTVHRTGERHTPPLAAAELIARVRVEADATALARWLSANQPSFNPDCYRVHHVWKRSKVIYRAG